MEEQKYNFDNKKIKQYIIKKQKIGEENGNKNINKNIFTNISFNRSSIYL